MAQLNGRTFRSGRGRFHGRFGVSTAALALALGFPALAQAQDTDEGAAQGDTIVVTGSRIAREGFDLPQPVTVVGAEQIGRQGASNVAAVLNDLPAFRPQNTASTTAIFQNNIGANTADLRGLGANRTLVLIDGRRVVPATVQGSSFAPAGAVDLNMVPSSLVERVEVVTGGASAAYGSDAVAGVVNLIINTNLQGIRASVQGGITDEGDNEEFAASLAIGDSFAGGRGRVVVGAEYVDVQGTGDCYSRAWCALSYNTVSNPLIDPADRSLGRVSPGDPATLILPNARTATATANGIVISGPLRGTEFNPDGTTFQHDYGTFFGAGIFQSGGGDDRLAFYENFPIASPSERINTFGHVEYDLTDAVTWFAEGSFSRVSAETIGAQRRDLGPRRITRDNPFIPDSVGAQMDDLGLPAIMVGRIWNDLGPQQGRVERDIYRAVTGFEAGLGSGWSLDAYYQYGQTNYSQRGFNTNINQNMIYALDVVTDPNTGDPICRAVLQGVAAAAGCQPINIFGEGSPSAAAADYVSGTVEQDTTLKQHVASLAVQGSLLELPGGSLALATGVEFRKDQATGTADPISTALGFYTGPGAPISGSVDVWEGFVEVVAPIVDMVELNGAVRLTDYSTSGSVTTWKVGADFAPADWIRFRATRSRDIRAPNIFELFGPLQSSFQSVVDGSTQVLASVLLGGNATLQPERADTWTAGVVLQPEIGPGNLRLSVDYYDIKLDGAISTLGAQVLVTRCNEGRTEFCQFIDRNDNDEITTIRNFNLNLNSLITRGWDIEASYRMPLGNGDLSLRALATIVDDLITVDSAGVAIDRAGMNGSPVSQPSGVPRYIINSYLSYDADPFAVQLQMRHIAAGAYNTALVGPGDEGYDPLKDNSINDNRIGAWTYFNLNASYDLWADGDRNLQLFGVVNNLFDKDPPVDAPSSFGPTNNVLYDVIGRSYKLGLRFRY
ncbi:TonB-dependent receptor [Altererythrobacter sp. KTW20L]|uniref:TonB-dependent receptor domain-containing protein n=1 Tax=Altererythrobacter sp. KTW20L TaxID=2942210 RepID=UPI0020C0AA27|nr:TonB-dependent receptor [Altererythrobacter sp. KTW20L]MCL6251575.1 TonB-dependent receptor [Altererythrobacter sp. KTW20L]